MLFISKNVENTEVKFLQFLGLLLIILPQNTVSIASNPKKISQILYINETIKRPVIH